MAKNKTMDVKIKNGNKSRKQDSDWDGVERMADDMKKRKLGRDSQGVRYWEDEGPTLSNTLLAALAEPKKGIVRYKGGKYAEAARRNTQASIATAQKFVVSNSMVEHAYLASLARPKSLLEMQQRGIPPFNNMWIEWDERFRKSIANREMQKMGHDPADQPTEDPIVRLGYHIEMINDRFSYSLYFMSNGEEGVASSPIGFHMSNDGIIANDDPNQDQNAFVHDTALVARQLMGNWWFDKNAGEDLNSGNQDHMSTGILAGSFTQTRSAAAQWLVSQEHFAQGFTAKEFAELKALSLNMQVGDGRFLIALLGLLNYDLVVHETTTPPKKIDHVRFGRVVPKNEYKVVTIQLPKPRGKRIYEQMFTGHGSPKREHWRRGHWRTVRDKSGNFKRRVWIGEMKCGNPALGTIVHDYNLEGK